MKTKLKLTLSLGLPLVLAGCATTYSDALKRYQESEPTVFHARTMAWTAEAQIEATDVETTGPLMATDPTLTNAAETTSPQKVEVEVIQSVLEGEIDDLAGRLDRLRKTGDSSAVLDEPVTWDELALLVAVRNPAVRAAAEQWQATLYQYSQADYLETLIDQYRTFTRYLDTGAGKPLNEEMTKRFFPYPSTIAYKGELIAEQARLARLEWEQALREALVEAGRQFFLYQYLVRAEATTRDNITLAEDLLGVVDQRYRAGEAGQADLLKLQTALERQRNMLEDLQDRQTAAVADLNALVDRPADAPMPAPSMRNLDVSVESKDALVQTALAHRQEVRMQESRVARTAIAIRMGEIMNRPLADLGYSRFERGTGPEASAGAPDMPFGQMQMFQEQPQFAQAEAYLAEMRQRLGAQRSMLNQVRTRTRALALSWLQDLNVARRQVRLVEEIVLPQNRSAYETLQSSYTSGRSSFIDLLDAERALLDARLELDAALRDLNQTIIKRATVTGRVPLENR
ncbi:TolC family protein [bacterium]|nr:TolC family protein [bacterium]